MGIYDGEEHFLFADAGKLITEDFVCLECTESTTQCPTLILYSRASQSSWWCDPLIQSPMLGRPPAMKLFFVVTLWL